jgi:hypothetical protein
VAQRTTCFRRAASASLRGSLMAPAKPAPKRRGHCPGARAGGGAGAAPPPGVKGDGKSGS